MNRVAWWVVQLAAIGGGIWLGIVVFGAVTG